MAKIRVYELARDLNMTSKVLLGKLKDMDIKVGSHVSSLEDDTVAEIKEQLFGGNIEESRIRPTVIRRRKRTIHAKPVEEETEADTVSEGAELEEEEYSEAEETYPEEAVATEESLVPEPVEDIGEMPEDVKSEPEPEPDGPETTTEIEPDTDSKPDVKADTAKVISKGESAKIIKKAAIPEEPEAEKESVVEIADDREETIVETPESPESVAETPEPTAEPEPVIETSKPEDAPESAESPEPESREATPEKSDQEKTEKTPSGKSKSKKKSRKSKKDMPAKIIALPTLTEEKPITEKTDAPTSEDENVATIPAPDTESSDDKDSVRKKKKRKKVGAEETEGDRKWVKKRISFRRKEVIEGDALYANGKRSRKGKKGGKMKAPLSQKPLITTPKAIKRRIKIDDTIVLADLAKRMGTKANEIIKKLLTMGVMVTLNQTLDFETAVLVASEFEYEVERASFEEENILRVEKNDPEKMEKRPPVVTIMGHVDHGKTSLLDVIRKTRVTESEAGGITQHIGAYHVPLESGQLVFLDTPGHEAFTSMRARGAKVTDIVVLVVAADDGVMPQTIEAINHSKAAGVPIIVAVNKIDKANADTDRVYRELSEQGLVPEDWGGDTIFVKVSAKQNQGIDELLELILLQSELLELKADPDKHAVGYVVESKLDSGRGPVATVLIQEGTLRAGDAVVCGIHHGKIRAMLNDLGDQVETAGPSIPVEILGLSGVPNAGDELVALSDDKSAKQVSSHRAQKQRSKDLTRTNRLSLDKLFERIQEGEIKDLNIILKADVHGSIEALGDSLTQLSNNEVSINIIHAATGTISESDVSLAEVSNAIIIGFNVRPSAKVQTLANEENVDMQFYNVIYDVIRDVKNAILGMMSSTYEEKILGRAEVRQVFHVPKMGTVAGSYITDGKVERACLVRLVRDGIVTFSGKLGSLRRFKDDVKEVATGYECGIGIENYNDIKIGDIIEAYYLEEIKPAL